MVSPIDQLRELEMKTGLPPMEMPRLLGVSYITYAKWRTGERSVQAYHARLIEVLLMLSATSLKQMIERHVNGNDTEE